MAIYNEILAGRFNKALTKLFSMKGPAPAPAVSSEIMPVIPLFFGVENRALEGWQRYAVSFNVAAGGAGNISLAQMTNHLNSGMLAVVEKIGFGLAGATQVVATFIRTSPGLDVADQATLNPTPFAGNDNRAQNAPAVILSSKNNTAASGTGVQIANIAGLLTSAYFDFIVTENQELPLMPASAYQFWFLPANQGTNVMLQWRERPLEDSERSL